VLTISLIDVTILFLIDEVYRVLRLSGAKFLVCSSENLKEAFTIKESLESLKVIVYNFILMTAVLLISLQNRSIGFSIKVKY